MNTIAAIALPIILAVMGIIASVKPPPNQGPWLWVSIGGFAVVGLLAFLATYYDRQAADTAQQELKGTIGGLKDSIDKLTKPPPANSDKPNRDPDTIYQNGSPAGKVSGARITLNESKVYFDQIENSGNLDRTKTFEYRDYVLRFVRADAQIGMLVAPGRPVATNVLQHVVAEIVSKPQ